MNADLRSIVDWSKNYGLKVNPSKTQVIIIGSPKLIAKVDWSVLPCIEIDAIPIPYSSTVKNLGLHLDQTLSWTTQIQLVRKKMFGVAASLRRLRNILPIPTKIALAQSLLFPILDYADVCYPDLNECQLNSLERLQNLCIRFIYGLRRISTSTIVNVPTKLVNERIINHNGETKLKEVLRETYQFGVERKEFIVILQMVAISIEFFE
ncbi:unnamed protein product [Colias eurytheme]|nr:unnamed protein product [Colias eurytheme]